MEMVWWSVVLVISCINLGIGIYFFIKSREENEDEYKKKMAIYGLIFLLVATYRSVFVSSYLTQLAWFDTILNSSMIIRTIAMAAEISFAIIISKGLLQFSKDFNMLDKYGNNKLKVFFIEKAPVIFVILLICAQPLAYGGLVFKFHVFFALEETLWGIGFLLILPLLLMEFNELFRIKDNKLNPQNKMYIPMIGLLTLFTVFYVIYSLIYHLPIEYWPAAIEQATSLNPNPEITFTWGAFKDALLIVNKTRNLSDWGGIGFAIWHTGYFTICGWIVLTLMRVPKKKIIS